MTDWTTGAEDVLRRELLRLGVTLGPRDLGVLADGLRAGVQVDAMMATIREVMATPSAAIIARLRGETTPPRRGPARG